MSITGDMEKRAHEITDLNEVIKYLNEDFPIRRINEVINNAIDQKKQKLKTEEEKNNLEKELKSQFGVENLSNWRKKGKPPRRDMAIKLAFALEMTYEETEEFLLKCKHYGLSHPGYGFHMRNFKDVIFRFGLENGWDYGKSTAKIAAIKEKFISLDLDSPNPDPFGDDAIQEGEITKYLNAQYEESIRTEEALDDFLEKKEKLFGTFRRTAYNIFVMICNQIRNEWGEIEDRNKQDEWLKSVEIREEISLNEDEKETKMREEIYDEIVEAMSEIKKGGLKKEICELIIEGIPARTGLSEIINKSKEDKKTKEVERNFLILAWLSCENGDITTFQDEDGSAKDNLFEHHSALNGLLKQCGMGILDPRHPFDWIILNALYISHIEYKKNEMVADNPKERLVKLFKKLGKMNNKVI